MLRYFNKYVVISALLILLLVLIYSNRQKLLPFFPRSLQARIIEYAPLDTFESAQQNGFSTNNFDLSSNILGDDSRIGLDEASLTEIRRLMHANSIGFDQARLLRHHSILKKNGIDELGFPMDPKAITSLA